MRFPLVLLIVLWPVLVGAQVSEQWVARYHGPVPGSADRATHIAVDNNAGNVYVTGSSQGTGTGFDYATVAYDSSGNQLWTARYNGPVNGDDIPNGIAVDSGTGNVYVTGESLGMGSVSDSATVAYDSSGNQLWVARYTNGAGLAIAVDSNLGAIYVTGHTGHGFRDTLNITIAYDSSGTQLWAAHFGGPLDTGINRAIAVDSTSGNVYVTGQHYIEATVAEILTIAYDSMGRQLWVRSAGGGKDGGYGLAVASTGNIYVTGLRLFNNGDGLTTVAYGLSGGLLWENIFHPIPVSGVYLTPLSIGVDSSTERAYVAGSLMFSDPVRALYYTTVAYDSSGNLDWLATNGVGQVNGISVDSCTRKIYVTGKSQGDGTIFDYTTVAYDSPGNELWQARRSDGVGLAIALNTNAGLICVTGQGPGDVGGTDFTTICYSEN